MHTDVETQSCTAVIGLAAFPPAPSPPASGRSRVLLLLFFSFGLIFSFML